jgi:phenylpropionate dioxygenase-like ring-hydroxylating dioxygenase large terminal subunit
MEGSEVFDKKQCSLPSYRLESWQGFLFVNLDDDAAPLRVMMNGVETATTHYRIHEQSEVFHYEKTWNGNWKLAAENSMEYYHHIGLHAGTAGIQMPAKGAYFPDSTQADDTFTYSHCRISDEYLSGTDHPLNPRGDLAGLTQKELETGYLVYVFPGFTMAMRAGTNNWLSFRPNCPKRLRCWVAI